MRILLLGDYSSLYNNLQDGLRELGHEVILASYGDTWKDTPRDIDMGGGGLDFISKISRKISPITKLKKITGYDVVQYINPFYFYWKWLPNKMIMQNIIAGNNKFFMSAAGDDAYYWKYARKNLRYGIFDDVLKYDINKKKYYMESKKAFEFNKWMVERSEGIIPIMYEYAEPTYGKHEKLKKIIPIPINVDKIKYNRNSISGKIIFFHGLNRYGAKGTRHIEAAFDYLSKKYKNDAEFLIKGKMPLTEYLPLMARVNVVIDQTSYYSLGMNGLYAMAMGKVVMGGAEPESLATYGVDSSPIVNILPSSEDVIEKIEMIIERRKEIQEMGRSSRLFVEEYHDYKKIANEYLSVWRTCS